MEGFGMWEEWDQYGRILTGFFWAIFSKIDQFNQVIVSAASVDRDRLGSKLPASMC